MENKKVEFDTENSEIEEEKEEEKYLMKRIPDLDADDHMIQTRVNFPKKTYKKLGELAFEREVSKASIVREALKEYLEKLEQPDINLASNPEPNVEVKDENLDLLLNRCTGFFGQFLTVEEDQGFFNLAKREGIKLKELSVMQFSRVADKLNVGYKGFADPPSIDTFMEWVEELDPTDEQKEFLRLVLKHQFTWTVDETTTMEELLKEARKYVGEEG